MSEHIIDFCYWIDEANLNQTNLQQKISAMFIKEIANTTNKLEWSEWSSLGESDKMERLLHLQKMEDIKEEYKNSPCVNRRKSNLKFEITYINREVIEEWSNWNGCFDSEFIYRRQRNIISEYIRTYSNNIFVRNRSIK